MVDGLRVAEQNELSNLKPFNFDPFELRKQFTHQCVEHAARILKAEKYLDDVYRLH